jgi:hypothetical protein
LGRSNFKEYASKDLNWLKFNTEMYLTMCSVGFPIAFTSVRRGYVSIQSVPIGDYMFCPFNHLRVWTFAVVCTAHSF